MLCHLSLVYAYFYYFYFTTELHVGEVQYLLYPMIYRVKRGIVIKLRLSI